MKDSAREDSSIDPVSEPVPRPAGPTAGPTADPSSDHQPNGGGDDEPIIELKPFEIEAFFSSEGPGVAEAAGDEADPEGEEVDPEAVDEVDPADPEASGSGDHGGASSIDVELPEIPGYRVEGVIGRGATGVVYRATQTAVDRAVALKILHPELITNRRAVKRLKREARLAAKLAHPSIISAIDMGNIGGLWWYAMELVEGIPLSRRIAERRSLSERECLRLFSPLCDALQHAHEVGVVHRDIKPANILIDQRGRARLVDLGLAMSENDPSITRTGSTLGTPHYVSPEQARDPSQADIRSDLWSLGATIYHAICGHPPFHSDEPDSGGVAEILSRVLYEPIVDPREFAPSLSKGFSLVLRKCLTRDPEQRYQEPWELVADIELLRERRRVDVSASQLDAYASRKHEWLVPALLVAGLLTAMGGTWVLTARPWENKTAPVIVERQATLGDWPALEAVRNGFDDGRLTSADALAELDTPTLIELPESAQFLRNKLKVDVRQALGERLRGFMASLDADVGAELESRDFGAAESISLASFSARLRAATGYGSLAELPEGSSKRRVLEWRAGQERRVASARSEAIRTAEEGLVRRYGMLANAMLDEALRENRWRDAMKWLKPSNSEEWLQRAIDLGAKPSADGSTGVEGTRLAEFDLSGLTAEERRAVARVIDSQIQSAESEVKYRVNQVLNEVRDFMQFQAGRLREGIEASTLRGDESIVERFDAALEAKHASENLNVEQLPAEFAAIYGDEIVKVRDELAYAEKRAQEALAERGVGQLEAEARPYLAARDYGAARELYRAARAEPWRVATFEALDLRIRELDILDEVLNRAAEGIEKASGESRELTFGQIPRRGRIVARKGEVLRLGFYFAPEFGTDNRILTHLRHLAGAGDAASRGVVANERLLETEDVLDFAGLSLRSLRSVDGEGPEPSDFLAAAAFLFTEGRPALAQALIRLEDFEVDDDLAADLERRARRAALAPPGSKRGPAGTPPEEGPAARGEVPGSPAGGSNVRSSQATDAERRSGASAPFMEFFGTPNQATNPRDVRLVWRFAFDSKMGGDRLKQSVPAGDDRASGWIKKSWELTPDGIELLAMLSEVKHFAQDVGPSLPLGAPLDISRRVRLDVELVPGSERPNGHIVAVSFLGHHALIARNKMWFGGGNLHDLYEYVRRNGRGRHEGFDLRPCPPLVEGVPFRLTIEMSPDALDRLEFNGESLGYSRFRSEPDRPDAFIRIRSLRPMAISGVELRGDREH